MAAHQLDRLVFSTSRDAEFLELRALQAQTGQPAERFGDVVIKELLDNALDAAESASVPPHIEVTAQTDGDTKRITVTDNGPGLPEEVIKRILKFGDTVSDKAAYRSPTRGLQGNAFKTLLGIPYALDVAEPVVIEAHGIRHEIAVSANPGGFVDVRHDQADSARTTGTAVTVPVPEYLRVDPAAWVQKFAAVNPHATLAYLADSADFADPVFCKTTAQSGWRKPLPTDPTSPHWYDTAALKRLVYAYIAHARTGGRDMPLGEFVRSFAGMTGRPAQKAVKEKLPGIERLTDFANDPDEIGVLLKAMQAEAKPKPLTYLGQIPEEHYRTHLDAAYGVERFWFQRRRLTCGGVPWLLEVAIADTARPGMATFGVNYSASFGDFSGATWLRHEDMPAEGAASFLSRADAWPEYGNDRQRAVVLHAVCPAPEFTDKGKVALVIPDQVADAFADALGKASRALRKEHKKAERDARAAVRSRNRELKAAERKRRADTEPQITIKDAVFTVLPEAIAHESDGGRLPFPTRNLFYSVRNLMQHHQLTDKELDMNYFSQDLVVQYERERGRITGHYRDPRGELMEPHTRKTVRLGTREVADYILPSHLFNKILYVEKEGFKPVFEASKIAERYDMAIASGKGQPVEAVRDLFARAEAGPGNYKLFVVHDADHHGYVIARAIAEETDRMPGYSVDVIDLGLSAADAIARGLPTERYTRRVKLPWWMPERLTDDEREWFEGRKIGKHWECTRVELNALGAAGLIDMIERGLERHDAAMKVIPSRDAIIENASSYFNGQIGVMVQDVLAELINSGEVKREVGKRIFRPGLLSVPQPLIRRRLRHNPEHRWTDVIAMEVNRRLDRDKMRCLVRELIEEQIQKHVGDDTAEAA